MARTVKFGAPEGARDPFCDEKEVMRTFHKHVDHCDTCYNSLKAWKSGRPLCSKGHGYVVDMRPYFFCKGGKLYSMMDRERRGDQNRVLVPVDYKFVNTLFEALSAGYSTKPLGAKAVVHQPVQPVRQPEIIRKYERPTIVVPQERYQPSRLSPRSADRYYEEKRYREPRSRGSLYYEDERRRQRYGGEELIFTSLPRSHRSPRESPRYHL